MQSQRIKLKISIKKITMNIKFPCSLGIQIKHDIPQDYKKLYELKNGQCMIGEMLQSQCQASYNTTKMRYEDKKIAINIFMVSNSGKVVSGSVYFTLFGKQPGNVTENVQFLQKCPDKQAKIYYTFSIDVLRRNERLDKTIHSEEPKKKIMNDSLQIGTLKTTKNQDKLQMARKERSPQTHQDIKASIVEGVLAFDRKPSYQFQIRQKQQRNSLTHRLKTDLNFKADKADRIKSNQKVKQTLQSKTAQSFYSPPEQAKVQHYQNLQQAQELTKFKNKLRILQNNQKVNAQNLREIKQDLQRKKNRINQLQASKLQLQESVRIKQDKNKRLQKQNKEISEFSEETSNQLKSIKSQLEIRQSIGKDQLKKLEDKYRQSQIQREKITQEYNRSLKNLEENQKKYQLSLKQKEKGIIQQRNKINKKMQSLTSTISQLQKDKKYIQLSLEELNKQKKLLSNGKSNLENQLSQALLQIQNQNNRLKIQNENNIQLQNQIQVLKVSEAEKTQLKKKVGENQLLINTLTEKNNLLQRNLKSNGQTISQLQHELQKKSQQKTQLSLKLNQIKKSYDNIKFSQEQKIKQSKSLAEINVTANTRISDLKYKLQIEKRSLQQIQRQYQERYIQINNEKNSLTNEILELRWEIQKYASSTNQLSMQLKAQNEEIYRLSQIIIQKEERIKHLEENIKQFTVSNQYLTASNADLQKKKKQSFTQIKQQNFEFIQLKKKHEKTLRQLTDLKQKQKTLEISHKQKMIQFQKKFKQKDEIIKSKNINIQSCQLQQKCLADEVSVLKQGATILQNQISHMRETISNNRKQCQSQENLIIKLKAAENDIKKTLSMKDNEIVRKDKQIQQLTKKITQIKGQSAEYRSNSIQALQKYFQELLRDNQSFSNKDYSNRIHAFPNQRISSLQLQYAQKVVQNSSKIKTKMAQMFQEKDLIQFQLNKAKNQYQETIRVLQQDLLRQRQKIKVLNLQLSKREQQEKSLITKDEELLTTKQRELQHHKTDIIKKEEQILQLQAQIQILITQYDNLKQENKQIQEKYLSFRSQEIKAKAQIQARNKQKISVYQQEIQEMKEYTVQCQKKIVSLQKEVMEKSDLIKKYQVEQKGIVYQCDKKDNRVNQLADRLREAQSILRQLQKSLKQKQKQLKKTTQSFGHTNTLLIHQKEKLQEALYKLQEQNHIILSLNKEIQLSKQQINKQKDQASQSQSLYKIKFEAMRATNQKIVQELKEIKQKNISLTSQIELKRFMATQLQHNINVQKEVKQQLRSQLQKKRLLVNKQTQELSSLQLKIKQFEQKINSYEEQKQSLTFANEKLKQHLNQMKSNLIQERNITDQIHHLSRQVQKANSQKRQLQQFYQRQISQIKTSNKDNKKSENSRITKQNQMQRRIKTLEKLLESQHPDLALERSRMIKQNDREKKQLLSKIETLQSKLQQVENELYALRHRSKRQIQKLTHQVQETKEESNAKDFFVRNQQVQIENLTTRLNQTSNFKQKLESQLEKEKQKFKKLQETVQVQQKQYRQKLKKIQEEEIKNMTNEIQKKLSSSKFKKLNMNFNEVQKMMLIGYYRQIEDIIASTVKEKRY